LVRRGENFSAKSTKRMLSNDENDGRASAASQQNEQDDDDVLVDQIYDKLLRESAVDVAAGMHRIFQTGGATRINSRSRRELYPTLYDDDDEVQAKLEQYVTTVPESHLVRQGEEMDSDAMEDATMDAVNVEAAAVVNGDAAAPTTPLSVTPPPAEPTAPVAAVPTTKHDIWGKMPLKEDPNRFALCRICGRQVSTLRFAPHLDKCMGLNSTTRTAAVNAASTIQAAIRSSNHGSS
jgi:hypothetical protein